MFAQRVCFLCLAAGLVMAGSASALSLTTADGKGADTYLANDSQSSLTANGPDSIHGAEVRMRAFRQLANTRSKTGYIRFDITGLGGDMSGATLTFDATSLKGAARAVEVYGLNDGDGDLWDESTLTYNTAAGVIPNPPTTLGNCVLDTAKVTRLGTITVPASGGAYPVTFSSTPADLPLTSFLEADRNGLVTFLFIGTDNEGEIASKEHETFNPPTLNLPNARKGPKTSATYLNPANEANDVPRDVVLSWTPGPFAATHDVYLGTSLDDVNAAGRANPLSALVSQGQDANTYEPPVRLEFGLRYSWRVDEVNAPPDAMVFRGAVWSFTVEPFVYQMKNIIATASSSAPGAGPETTVNDSGLDAQGLHSTLETAMWASAKNAPQPAWIRYEFDGVYKLYVLWVWNYNHSFESTLGFGFKDLTIEYSINGTDWTVLRDVQLAQAPGENGYAHLPPVDMQGVAARYVRLTAKSNFSGMSQFGLSEVQFYYLPAHPREPIPAAAATGVDVDTMLSWRAGREAAAHKVYFSTDQQAVLDGTALAGTSDVSRFDPGPLNYGRTYFWRVTEVNESETIPAWDGALWSFATQEYLVVDDFESYNDEENQGTRIYETWIDGYADASSGSTVGNIEPPFAEQTIIHGGKQSMPMDYNNINSPFFSEAVRTWDTPQDWTTHGADELVLYFRGNRVGFLERSAGTFTMSGVGTDIYGTSDQFQFAWKSLSGDGTIIAKVDSIEAADPWSKAGVMVRESLEPGARFAAVYATPGNGVRYQARLLNAGDATSDTAVATEEQRALKAPVWIKLERTGLSINCSYSTDGTKWTPMSWNPQTLALNGTVYLGLAVTSHVAGVAVTGEFSGVSVTGATGSWQRAAIGVTQPDNDADQLYVAVEDSAKHKKIIKHPDPQAVLLDTWQRWSIPLADLQAGGVNLQKVKNLYLGVGDRTNPVQSGAGRIYIDDIGVGHAAAVTP